MLKLVDLGLRGSGLRPCISTRAGNKVSAVAVATVIASDDSVEFRALGDTLAKLLAAAGAPELPQKRIALGEFRRRFSRLSRPDCRYQVRLVEKTEYVRARDTVGLIFSTVRVR